MWSTAGLNSESLSPLPGIILRLKNRVNPTIYSKPREVGKQIMFFSRALARSEIQTASFRI